MIGFLSLSAAIAIALAGVLGGRWLASRAFGLRGRAALSTASEAGRPRLACARAGASIAGYYLACVLLFAIGFGAGGDVRVDEVSMRVNVGRDGPAERAGLVDGDRIVKVDGEAIESWDQLKSIVRSHGSEPIVVDVERQGGPRRFDVSPVGGKIMVGPYSERVSMGAGALARASFGAPFGVAKAAVLAFFRMFVGGAQIETSGPVGIAREVGSAAEHGPGMAFKLTAAIASYYWLWVTLGLLCLCAVSSRRKTVLPTAGNSS